MSHRRILGSALTVAVAVCLAGSPAMHALAAPSAAQTSADRLALERAVEQYKQAQQRSADIDARMARTSEQLDQMVAQEKQARTRLSSRARAMYRSPDTGFISVLLGASSIQDLVTRWDLLARIARQDAETLMALKTARAEAERSAEKMIDLQAEEARSLDTLADEVARAKKELAASQASLKEYQARIAASARPAPAPTAAAPVRSDPTQKLSGSGEWLTAVASHYGRNFTGRGASGEKIGPYSMIVAHKTLPFGTLVEFEYNGKRAVARVADRGPFTPGRTFDLGPGVVRILGFEGVHEVRYRVVSR